ncbi:ATP-dependent Clp protease ATP-binding subunit [Chitinophagaceae bacterium MMS25-I14]
MSVLFANDTVKQTIHIAQSIARENYNAEYGAPHLLRALLHKEAGIDDFLRSIDKDPGYFMEWADVRIESYPKTTSLPETPASEAEVESIMEEAEDVRLRLGLDEVTPVCLLAALVKPHMGFTPEQLRSLPLRDHEIFTVFRNDNAYSTPVLNTEDISAAADNNQLQAIRKYCTDKTQLAASGKTDPITGREREVRTLIEILGRRNKPNVIISGDPGVGKTALVEGFAYEIINGNVPLHLQNAILLELDMGALMAGASYKGEIEDRLKKVLTEMKKLEHAILFIDEIHLLLDNKGSIGSGAANLLKPELARGEITVIGATTQEEYRKIVEPEQAFNRRFELLTVEEPDFDTCCKMVQLLADRYEKHHGVKINADAIPECVRLSKRYAKEKKLPDAALDLLDRTMSAIKMLDETSRRELENWKQEYDQLQEQAFTGEQEKLKEYKWYYLLLQNVVSPILWGMLEEQPSLTGIEEPGAVADIINAVFTQLEKHAAGKRDVAGKLELAAVMAAKTGIPIGKIQAREKDKLLRMEEYLLRRVVGQDHALKALSDAIIESRSGINKPGQPIGSFFLLGPTGTGKTELAKSIAELLFNDEKAMIRFDMSEFKEEHSAALLYGAPPGYVGYEEGGMLVNKIRQQPYAVVLFDEIEKAHPSVFDVFLQIMDEGKINDKLGKQGDFSNALILFTSNIGSSYIADKFQTGEIPSSSELMQVMTGHFRPEFLARLTEILPFAPITEEIATRIFHIQLKTLIEPLKRMGIGFIISDEAARRLALNGFSSKYGARQIGGVIRTSLSRPVSRMLVKEEVKKGNTIHVGWENNTLSWNITG